MDESEPTFSLPEPVSAVNTTKAQAATSKGAPNPGGKTSLEIPSGSDRSKVFHSSDGPVQKILDGTKEPVQISHFQVLFINQDLTGHWSRVSG